MAAEGAAAGKALRGRGGSVRRASRCLCGRGELSERGLLDRQARKGEYGRTGLRGETILRRGRGRAVVARRRGEFLCVREGVCGKKLVC